MTDCTCALCEAFPMAKTDLSGYRVITFRGEFARGEFTLVGATPDGGTQWFSPEAVPVADETPIFAQLAGTYNRRVRAVLA